MTVKGLKLSNSSYHVELDLLTERFGDPRLLISAHIGNLLNLSNVPSINDLQELLISKKYIIIRNFGTLKIS